MRELSRTMKKTALILIAALAAVTLIGCSGEQAKAFDALFANQPLRTKTDMLVEYKLSIDGYDEDSYEVEMYKILNLFNFKLDYEVIQTMSADRRQAQASAKLKGELFTRDIGTYAGLEFWVNMDYSDLAKPKMTQIYRLPDVFSGLLQDKEYAVIDMEKLTGLQTDEMTKSMSTYLEKLFELDTAAIMREAFKDMNVPVQPKTTDGKMEVTVKLTDKEAMSLINSGIKALSQSELTELITAFNFDEYTAEMLSEASIDIFISELSKVNYIGKNGVEFSFTAGKNGVVESYTADIDLRFNMVEINDMINTLQGYGTYYGDDITVGLRTKVTAKIEELAADEAVQFPEINGDNSFDVAQNIIASQEMNALAYEDYRYINYDDPASYVDFSRPGYTLYMYGDAIELGGWGIMLAEDGVVMAPVRTAVWNLGYYNVIYDEESQNVWLNEDTRVKVNSSAAYLNGSAVTLDAPAQYIGESIYVPLDFVLSHTNHKVDWMDVNGGKAGIITWHYNNDWMLYDEADYEIVDAE